MLTRPTKFSQHQRRDGAHKWVIVKIVSGATTYLLGTETGHLTDGPVYGLLLDYSVNHSVDWVSNFVPPGTASFTFNNAPFNPYGTERRLSELWHDIAMATVTVYLGAGPITALSDCLTVFIGYVSGAPTYTETTLTLQASDPSQYIHKVLPDTLVETAYPNCPRANRTDKIPVIYGDFRLTGSAGTKIVSGGLAPAIRVSANKYCLSDHELVSADAVWAWIDALNMAVELATTVSLSADDSDRGTTVIYIDGSAFAYAYLYPSAEYDTADADQNDATDPLNAAADDDVYAIIVASGDNLTLFFAEDFGPGELGTNMDNGIGKISAVALQVRNEIESGATFTSGTKYAKSADGSDSNAMTIGADKNTWQTLTPLGTNTKWVTASQGIYWALARGNEDSNGAVKVACTAVGTPGASGLVRVYCVRIRVYLQYQPGIVEKCFSECRGRKFGSWIDNAGHSNAFSAGDLIQHPNYIVESFLIDELGAAEAAIDHASFDAAYNENLTMRLALHTGEQRSSDEIIKEIGLHGMFALYFSPAGTWKLISWDKEYITSRTIITGPDITIESIGTTPWEDIINKLIIYYNYRYDKDACISSMVVEDSDSQTKFGTRTKEVSFRYLTEEAVEYVHERYAGYGGLWSRPWPIIRIKTPGLTNAQLEIGDYVRLDADLLDGRLLYGIQTWEWIDVMVIEKSIDASGTRLGLMLTPGRITIPGGTGTINVSGIDPDVALYDVTPP